LPAPKTEISEIVTALGMTAAPTLEAGLAAPTAAFVNVPAGVWARLRTSYEAGEHADLFGVAWDNGRAFLAAADALRGRPPARIEWRGPTRPVGYDTIPADLRVDHVYLVSCKHLSRVLHNIAPAHLFERALIVRRGSEPTTDWYLAIAGDAYQTFYDAVREVVAIPGLPRSVSALSSAQRNVLRRALSDGKRWPGSLGAPYVEFAHTVARASAARWSMQLSSKSTREEQLWRLLRHASAPYFVLGASVRDPMRLRIATPWDWRQAFEFRSFDIVADEAAAQPQVRWASTVRRRSDGAELVVSGYVEIRWSHGRFRQPPEAKVQLSTNHEDVPGYFALH